MELRQIRMGHSRIRIQETNDLDPGDFGAFCDQPRLIQIRKGLKYEEQLNTLLHEMIHAAWAMDSLGEDASEERAASCLANRLSEAFLRNPALRAFVAGER